MSRLTCLDSLDRKTTNMFSLTLPSNASPLRHPDNSVATFKTQLAEPIHLHGTSEYEIGLAEIQHPTLIKNVNDCWVKLSKPGFESEHKYLENGLYNNEEDFFKELGRRITESTANIGLFYIGAARKVTLMFNEKCSLNMSRRLADILGFQSTIISNATSDQRFFEANQSYDLYRGLDQIFVYSDICANVPLGHNRAPLLRCVRSNIANAPKQQCTTFNKINFVPMKVRNFDSILVYLRTSTGEPIPFMSGTCIVSLVIRRKAKYIF